MEVLLEIIRIIFLKKEVIKKRKASDEIQNDLSIGRSRDWLIVYKEFTMESLILAQDER